MSRKTLPLPTVPGADRWIQINYQLTEAYIHTKSGSMKLFTSRWASPTPALLAEIILKLGHKLEDFSYPSNKRLTFTWSFLPIEHALDTVEPQFGKWLKTVHTKTEPHDGTPEK